MRAQETMDALVLSSVDSGDSRVVQLLTAGGRRVPCIARRARRKAGRVSSHLNPLTLIDVTLSERPNRDLATIHDARTRQPFPMIRGDLRRWALATTMAEVILHLIPQHAGENGVFALLQKAWAHLNNTRHEASEDLLFLFELRILSFTGVLPPPDELVELPEGARDTLVKWLSGQWVPLASDVRLPVQRLLEGLIEEASGRPLRSRAFLDETLADGTL